MATPDRAFAVLVVKSFDAARRSFAGIATTPELDRQGHRVEPAGVTFANPLPLLFFHDQKRPIGSAILSTTPDGITFDATIADVLEPGPLKERVDEAWQSIKAGLIRGVSIGLRPLVDGIKLLKDGTVAITKCEVVELSLVTIPANTNATILTVKQYAAPGDHTPGDTGIRVVHVTTPKGTPVKTTNEQISAFEATRAAKSARMVEIMTKDDGSTLDAAQTEEYDGLAVDVKSIDAHLTRLRDLEKLQVAAAIPIKPTIDPVVASNLRGSVITVKANVPPATAFIRYCQAIALGRGNILQAVEYAKQWHDSTPEVELVLKAAVAAGTTTDATWAGPLAPITPLANEFVALLRPATILGKVPGFVQVPFNVSVAAQTGGGSYSWVGQGAPKPVGKARVFDGDARDHQVRRDHRDHVRACAQLVAVGRNRDPQRHDRGDRGVP
jgi:Phage head maturation protease